MTRIAVWTNTYKEQGSSQPDGRGHLEIDCTLVQELAAAMAQGQGMTQDAKGNWVFKLSLSAWRGNGQNPQAPILSGTVATLGETQQRAAAAAAKRAQAPAGDVWGAPAAAPAPPQPMAYQQPAPAPVAVAAPPAPVAPPMPSSAAACSACRHHRANGGWQVPAAF